MSGFVRLNKRVVKPTTASTTTTTTPNTLSSTTTPSQSTPNVPSKSTDLGTGTAMAQPVQVAAQQKQQQRLLSKVAATAQMRIPNGCKPWVASQFLTSTGIKDLDNLLGGGVPLHTLNSIIVDSRTEHSDVFTKAFLWEGHLRKQRCLYVSTKPNRTALQFSQHVLRPALVNQKATKNNTSASTTTTSITAGSTSQNNTNQIKSNRNISIDDEEDLFVKKSPETTTPTTTINDEEQTNKNAKPTKITQGKIQDALHDGKNVKLTIAWQYDRYQGKTMDDSNLSGVNDDDIVSEDDDNNDDDNTNNNNNKIDLDVALCDDNINDNDKKITKNSSLNTLFNTFDRSDDHINGFINKFDYHIITPSLSQQQSTQTNTFDTNKAPLFDQTVIFPDFSSPQLPFYRHIILSKILSTIALPTSPIHLVTNNNNNTDATTNAAVPSEQSTPIVPNRILIELSPELLQEYAPLPPQNNNQTDQEKYKIISFAQFMYTLLSITSSTPTLITLLIPPTIASHPSHYNIISSLSQLLISMASFTGQTSLSNQDIAASQIGSAANLFGDKHDGLLTFYKFPRVNTASFSYKLPDSTLFLYRLKKQLTVTMTSTATTTIPTLGIAKLVLPPEVSRSGDAHSGGKTIAVQDLFDEAINEITKRALHNNNNNNETNETNTKVDTNQQQSSVSQSGHNCPTCGMDTPRPAPNSTNPLVSTTTTKLGSNFGLNKTSQEQLQIQQQRAESVITEENEDEDHEE